MLRDEHVALCPDHDVDGRCRPLRRARSPSDCRRQRRARPRGARRCIGGDLLPQDRYEEWAEERREQLRLRRLELLRLDGQWETVVEHRSRRRGRQRQPDAPLRRGRRPARRDPPVRAPRPSPATRARRRPGPRRAGAARPPARRSRRRRRRRDDTLVGRDRETGAHRTGAARFGERAAAERSDRQRSRRASGSRRCSPRSPRSAEGDGLSRRARHVGAGRGRVAVCARGRGAGRPLPSSPDAARRPRRPPPRGDRSRPRRRRDRVERGELAPAAVRGRGRARPSRGSDARAAAHHRRRPRRRRRQPATAPLPRPIDARPARLHRAHPPAGPDVGHAWPRPARASSTGTARPRLGSRPLATTTSPTLVRRHVPDPTDGADRPDRGDRPGRPVRGQRARPAGRRRAGVGAWPSTPT